MHYSSKTLPQNVFPLLARLPLFHFIVRMLQNWFSFKILFKSLWAYLLIGEPESLLPMLVLVVHLIHPSGTSTWTSLWVEIKQKKQESRRRVGDRFVYIKKSSMFGHFHHARKLDSICKNCIVCSRCRAATPLSSLLTFTTKIWLANSNRGRSHSSQGQKITNHRCLL